MSFYFSICLKLKLICMFITSFSHSAGAPSTPLRPPIRGQGGSPPPLFWHPRSCLKQQSLDEGKAFPFCRSNSKESLVIRLGTVGPFSLQTNEVRRTGQSFQVNLSGMYEMAKCQLIGTFNRNHKKVQSNASYLKEKGKNIK